MIFWWLEQFYSPVFHFLRRGGQQGRSAWSDLWPDTFEQSVAGFFPYALHGPRVGAALRIGWARTLGPAASQPELM